MGACEPVSAAQWRLAAASELAAVCIGFNGMLGPIGWHSEDDPDDVDNDPIAAFVSAWALAAMYALPAMHLRCAVRLVSVSGLCCCGMPRP